MPVHFEKRNIEEVVKEHIEDPTEAIVRDIADIIFTESQKEVPVDRTTLKDSGYISELLEEGHVSYEVGYNAPHGPYVHWGTEPHLPPFKPLHAWTKRVLALKEPEATRVANAIRWKIAKYGTDAHPFLLTALERARSRIPDIIAKAKGGA